MSNLFLLSTIARLPRLFQSTCLLCGCRLHGQQQPAPAYFGLCHFCHADLPFIARACRQCGIPLPDGQSLCGDCISTPPAFDSTCCAVTYENAVIPLIHRFKTRHHNAIARLLAELLLSRIQSQGVFIDVIIPAPMSIMLCPLVIMVAAPSIISWPVVFIASPSAIIC